jgi:hypothetical protein
MQHLFTIDKSTYIVLKDIFKIPIIQNNFALAGGTSLALQIGHQKSIDLDIFLKEKIVANSPNKSCTLLN